MNKLVALQSKIKVPKTQENKFGGYKYRSCEDILEAVKPLLAEMDLSLIISDEIVMIGNRYYVKATATLRENDTVIGETTAYAREPEMVKGQQEAQVTGASSSYARKYALNGLFDIDDTRDSDATNTGDKDKPNGKYNEELVKKLIKGTNFTLADAEKWTQKKYGCSVNELDDAALNALMTAIKNKIEGGKQ